MALLRLSYWVCCPEVVVALWLLSNGGGCWTTRWLAGWMACRLTVSWALGRLFTQSGGYCTTMDVHAVSVMEQRVHSAAHLHFTQPGGVSEWLDGWLAGWLAGVQARASAKLRVWLLKRRW